MGTTTGSIWNVINNVWKCWSSLSLRLKVALFIQQLNFKYIFFSFETVNSVIFQICCKRSRFSWIQNLHSWYGFQSFIDLFDDFHKRSHISLFRKSMIFCCETLALKERFQETSRACINEVQPGRTIEVSIRKFCNYIFVSEVRPPTPLVARKWTPYPSSVY